MKFDLIIRHGTVVTPTSSFKADIGVNGEQIAAIGTLAAAEAGADYDATGKLVFPGFIDEHVHSRDPGLTHKEDFAHATRAAAAGGITTIVEMPNSIPPVYDAASLASRLEALRPAAHVDFALWGMVLGDANVRDLAPMAEAGVVGFKLFWGYALDRKTLALVYDPKPGQDIVPPPDDGQIFEAFETIASTGLPVAIHAENAAVINRLTQRVRSSADDPYEAMLRSRPPFTEAMTVDAGIRLADAVGVHLHVLHVSCAEATDRIALARSQGKRVTAETCPHYLYLTDADYPRLGTMMKVFPPVRRLADQDRLWQGVREGTISVIGSDHAPHTPAEKEGGLWSSPAGAATIQATVPLLLDAVDRGRLSANELAAVLCENPARLLGLYGRKGVIAPGADADLVVVDMHRSMTIRAADMLSKNHVTPYDGMEVAGTPVASFLRGRQIMRDGRLLGQDAPAGTFLKRER